MADVQWIKIFVNMFDTSRKIKRIEKMKNGDTIIVIWFKLLCMAGAINDGGAIYVTKDIPYTLEDLADDLRKKENIVQTALDTFVEHGMIFKDDAGFIVVKNWEKYQNVEGLEKVREQNRKRVAAYRERQKEQMESEICQYCGKPATGYDHIVATARGGTDDDNNKIPCCKECNNIKNDKPLVDFLNNNRNRINDDFVTSNNKLRKLVTLCNVTNRYNVTLRNAIEEEEEGEEDEEKEFHSFNHSCAREDNKENEFSTDLSTMRKRLGGTLGAGVVFLSDEQINRLLDLLSLDEFDYYVGVVRDQELQGKHYKKKTHFQAILDMAMKDRKTK